MIKQLNFRDALCFKRSKCGLFYRSARLDDATDKQIEQIAQKVDFIIDLRRSSEIVKCSYMKSFQIEYVDLLQPVLSQYYKQLGLWIKIQFFCLVFSCQIEKAKRFLAQSSPLATLGLQGMYAGLLEHSKSQICLVFEHLLEAVGQNRSVLVHCSAGKDRTGIIVMLLQLLLGIDEQEIIADYAESKENLKPLYKEMLKHTEKLGLPADFVNVEPEIMLNTINLIHSVYGGIEMYLIQCGFSREKQKLLFKLLTKRRIVNP